MVWAALTGESGCSIMIVNADGVLSYANHAAIYRFGFEGEGVGAKLHDALPDYVAEEQLDMIRLTLDHGGPIQLKGMLKGVFCLISFRTIPDTEGLIFMLVRPCPAQVPMQIPGGPRIMRSRFDDHGRLESLTSRELEVLRLIGLGRSTAAIAEELHRSVKTIEWHRVALGNKLGARNRIELARIAVSAGLAPLDDSDAGVRPLAEQA